MEKTPSQILEAAQAYAVSIENEDGTSAFDWVAGYTQCLEDGTGPRYTAAEVKEIVEKSRATGLSAEYLMLQLDKRD